jgi:hypothetical protein
LCRSGRGDEIFRESLRITGTVERKKSLPSGQVEFVTAIVLPAGGCQPDRFAVIADLDVDGLTTTANVLVIDPRNKVGHDTKSAVSGGHGTRTRNPIRGTTFPMGA